MPILKARPEPPGLPSRSSSVPPIHLHSPGIADASTTATCLPSLAEPCTPTRPSKRNVFAWSRLPQHIHQGILAHALLPDGPGTPIAIGLPEHRAHLKATAVPIFLALGSWEAYGNAAAIFYQHIYVNLSLFQGSAMTFLTSSTTLRPRSLVVRIELHFAIKEHLVLFDTGHTVSQSMGKLIKMNVPTALRSMKTHGRLSEVELLILRGQQVDPDNGRESAAPGYHFPMARIQLAGWTPAAESDDLLQPVEAIVAPAFLACRAFQSGFLPLLEDGAFEKTRLALQSVGDINATTTANDVDRNTLIQYWLGATVIELLDFFSTIDTWADPFLTTAEYGGPADEMVLDLTLSSGSDMVAPSREIRHELLSSPIKYPSSSSGSDTDSSGDEVVIKFDTLRDDTEQEEQYASRIKAELSDDDDDDDDDDTSSEGSSSSEEVVRELHKKFGATPRTDYIDSFKDGTSSSSTDDSDDSSPSPAAMHLEIARAELITTLTAAITSDDTMEAIARATADRQVTSFGVSKGPCMHTDAVSNCSTCQNMSEDSSESSEDDDDDIPRMPACKVPSAIRGTGPIDLDGTVSGHLLSCDSTRLDGDDDEADSDTDTDTDTENSSSIESPRDEREHRLTVADLSHMEEVFGARAEDVSTLDVHGGAIPTNCILASMASVSERANRQSDEDKMAGGAESIDLSLDKDDGSHLWVDGQASKGVSAEPTGQAEAQAGTKPDHPNSPQMTTPTTPAHHSSDFEFLTPLSAGSKASLKSKGTQTKRVPNKPAKVHRPGGQKTKPAAAANNSHVSKKRKAPDGGARSSRASRRKRARLHKEKQLRLAKRIEAEAAERDKTLVN